MTFESQAMSEEFSKCLKEGATVSKLCENDSEVDVDGKAIVVSTYETYQD